MRIEPGSRSLRDPARTPRSASIATIIRASGRLAPGLRVAARRTRRAGRGAGASDHPFGVAVQWHPERLPDEPHATRLFRRFVDAAAEYQREGRTRVGASRFVTHRDLSILGSAASLSLRAVRQQMPDESIAYVGDQQHVPYGPRPLAQVRGFRRPSPASCLPRARSSLWSPATRPRRQPSRSCARPFPRCHSSAWSRPSSRPRSIP